MINVALVKVCWVLCSMHDDVEAISTKFVTLMLGSVKTVAPTLYLATDTAVSRLSPVTIRQRSEADLNSWITPDDSGFRVFCITRKPRKIRSLSASSLVI